MADAYVVSPAQRTSAVYRKIYLATLQKAYSVQRLDIVQDSITAMPLHLRKSKAYSALLGERDALLTLVPSEPVQQEQDVSRYVDRALEPAITTRPVKLRPVAQPVTLQRVIAPKASAYIPTGKVHGDISHNGYHAPLEHKWVAPATIIRRTDMRDDKGYLIIDESDYYPERVVTHHAPVTGSVEVAHHSEDISHGNQSYKTVQPWRLNGLRERLPKK